MNNLLLDIVQGENGSFYFSDFPEALIYALLGFLIVFAGIAIIIAVIWLIGLLMRKTNNLAFLTNRKQKPKPVEKTEETKPVTESDEVPDEVKAAIIAAIMAYYETEQPQCEFKVKRIKRI